MSVTEVPPDGGPPPPEFTLTARAFEEQFDYVYRAMRRFGVSEPDVEDLVQEVFLVMWRRWAEYERHRPLRPWLAGIAFHIAQKHISRGRREVPRGEVDREDEAPHPDERLASARSRDVALRALAALPPKQRVLLVMHDLDGIEMRQIAATLQVPLFTAYSRLRRARIGFTRAVEDTQRQLAAPSAAVAAYSASAVLESERQLVAAPADARRRARRQLRALIALPGGGPLATKSTPPAPWIGRLRQPPQVVTAAAAAVLLSGAAIIGLRVGQTPSVTLENAGRAARAGAAEAGRPFDARPRRNPLVMASVIPPARLAPGPAAGRPGGQPSLNQGLSGYWRFDDGYGSSSARDLSASGRDCRLNRLDPNGAWVPGALSGAIALDRGFVECPQPAAAVRSTHEMSVAAWVKVEAWGSHHVAVASRPVAVEGKGTQDYFMLGMIDGKLKVRSDFWNIRVTARSRMPLGRWVHVAFSYDREANLRLYMDGKAIGHRQSPRKRRQGQLGPVIIGAGIGARETTQPDQQLSGAVDEVAIYDRALSPEEVAALAAGEQPRLSL